MLFSHFLLVGPGTSSLHETGESWACLAQPWGLPPLQQSPQAWSILSVVGTALGDILSEGSSVVSLSPLAAFVTGWCGIWGPL